MDEEQQIIQEPVQEPAPEKQSDKTQAILTAVSPLVAVFFGGSAGVNIIPPLICWLVWKDANPLVDKVGKNILNASFHAETFCLIRHCFYRGIIDTSGILP